MPDQSPLTTFNFSPSNSVVVSWGLMGVFEFLFRKLNKSYLDTPSIHPSIPPSSRAEEQILQMTLCALDAAFCSNEEKLAVRQKIQKFMGKSGDTEKRINGY